MSKKNPTVSERRGYIGGSDAATVLGLGEFSTPLQLWAEKTGRGLPMPPDPARDNLFYFGHLLEESIGQAVSDRYGLKLLRTKKFYRSAAYPWMGGHIDFILQGQLRFLECKNVRYDSAWGDMMPRPLEDEGSHLIPEYYLAQCLHYLAVLAMEECYIAALIGGCELRIYLVTRKRNEKMYEELIEAERLFWYTYVLPDEMPDSVNANDVLRRRALLPADPGEDMRDVTFDEEQVELLHEFGIARAQENEAKKKAERLRNRIIVAADGPGKLLDAKGGYIGNISLASRFGLDEAKFAAEAPTAYQLYRHFHDDSYYFRINLPKDKAKEKSDG